MAIRGQRQKAKNLNKSLKLRSSRDNLAMTSARHSTSLVSSSSSSAGHSTSLVSSSSSSAGHSTSLVSSSSHSSGSSTNLPPALLFQGVIDLISSYVLTEDPGAVSDIIEAHCTMGRFSKEINLNFRIDRKLRQIAGIVQLFRVRAPNFVAKILNTEYRVRYKPVNDSRAPDADGMHGQRLHYFSELQRFYSARKPILAELGFDSPPQTPSLTIDCHLLVNDKEMQVLKAGCLWLLKSSLVLISPEPKDNPIKK